MTGPVTDPGKRKAAVMIAMTRIAPGWQIDGPYGPRLVCCGSAEKAAETYLDAGHKEEPADV